MWRGSFGPGLQDLLHHNITKHFPTSQRIPQEFFQRALALFHTILTILLPQP